MKLKTSELTGAALDWAACEIAGLLDAYPTLKPGPKFLFAWTNRSGLRYMHSSTDWSQGGPIIEREKIDCAWSFGHDCWESHKYLTDEMVEQYGPTPLIAAMRCFVASRLGEFVDVPEELCK